MGFGILLIGYFFAGLMKEIHPVFAMIGYAVILLALEKLKNYQRSFGNCRIPAALALLFAAYESLADVLPWIGVEWAFFRNETVAYVVSWLSLVVTAIFLFLLFIAILRIGAETGTVKVRDFAARNIVLYGIYLLAQAVYLLPLGLDDTARHWFYLGLTIFCILCFVCQMILFLRCYRSIADADAARTEDLPDLRRRK